MIRIILTYYYLYSSYGNLELSADKEYDGTDLISKETLHRRKTMKKSQQLYLLILSFLGMLMFALTFNYRGFLVPTFKAEFGIDNTRIGLVISIAQLVSMVFTYFGGVYCLRFGQKRIIALGCFIVAISMMLLSMAHSFTVLLLSFCGISSGASLLVLGLNTILPLVTMFSQSILMNVVHGIFGLGSTGIQKALAWYLSKNLSWRLLFIGTAGMFVLHGILMLFAPGEPTDEHKAHKASLPYKKFSILLISALAFYVIAEFLLGSWIINYFQEGYAFTPVKAAFYSTLFYATFTIGRLGGGFIMNRVKRLQGIIVCTILAAVSVFSGQIMGGPFFFLIGLSGLFFSIVYPTAVTISNEVYGKEGPYFIGIASTATALGIFGINLVFGYLNDALGVVLTFYGVPLCMAISAFFFILTAVERKKLPLKALVLEEPEQPSFCRAVE